MPIAQVGGVLLHPVAAVGNVSGGTESLDTHELVLHSKPQP